MRKKDLKVGNVVETRTGLRCLKQNNGKYYCLSGYGSFSISNSTETLESLVCRENDIVKVYEDYTCQKVLWERKEEKSKPTEGEKTILKNLPKEYKYIARDDKNQALCIYIDKPKKESSYWFNADFLEIEVFKHLFQFIKWEDEEPYLISDLLEEN